MRIPAESYDVTVCGSGKRDLRPCAEKTGATLAESPKEVAENSQIVFSMIPDSLMSMGLRKDDNTSILLVAEKLNCSDNEV